MTTPFFFQICFYVFLIYFSVLTVYSLVLSFVSFFEEEKRFHETDEEDYRFFLSGHFSLPVSVIIPAHNEETGIMQTVYSILNQRYPELEIIIVDDGSTDQTFPNLQKELQLQSTHTPFEDRFDSGNILGLFISQRFPNIQVIRKESGKKKAGALNAGLNLARYRYICTIDADTLLKPDALLQVMAMVQRDPDHILGIGSYFSLSNPHRFENGKLIKQGYAWNPLIAFQNLEYLQSFIGNRIAWSRWNAVPIESGGFNLWRRDILDSCGGFDSSQSSEDLEFTLRVHDIMRRKGNTHYRIVTLPYLVGWTEGPESLTALITQRRRWHRVEMESVWKYRHMFLNPRYGVLGCLTFPYYVFYEIWGVFFEVASLIITGLGFFLGYLDLKLFAGITLFMILSQTFNTLMALFLVYREQKLFHTAEVAYLGCLSFTQYFFYRWIILISRIWGTFDFFMKKTSMDAIPRSKKSN